MKGNGDSQLAGTAKAAIAFALIVLLLPAAWLFNAYDRKYRVCEPLGNGMYLGYEAIFDLSRPSFKPIAVPKFPDGTPLIRDETWAIFVTATTIYGLAMAPSPDEDYRFAWRSDIGLIRQQDHQAAYEALIAEAGPANLDIEIDSVGTGWLLNELLKQQPASERCPTPLLTW
ncbi:hypothetical protein [Pseudogemmobacter faecipullorum]|uniref:DUF1254 domain-containing protein n=1 Tax=Pseudogemmobacter faecipullorum TaxID=2755041 RepID=A0ABS8CNW7_9RHOB|nr:hypothetical protein [Pseudogemmobacter faecipullorum]MCB5411092.1 hypothetical protein [Pseudogemmobacter faecipullorum]